MDSEFWTLFTFGSLVGGASVVSLMALIFGMINYPKRMIQIVLGLSIIAYVLFE